MARKKLHDPINNEDFDLESSLPESEGSFYENNADSEANELVDSPVFIARMPNLEEPRSIRKSISAHSVWNRIFEFQSKVTDRQQILSLWCVIAVLVCLLFWSFLRNMSPNVSEIAQTETSAVLDDEDPFRLERSSNTVSERIAFSDHSSARSVYDMEEELSLVLPTTDIEVSTQSEHPEVIEAPFDRASVQPVFSASPPSAWDREESTLPAAVNPQPAMREPTPDFSALANEQWNGSSVTSSSNPAYANVPSTFDAPVYGSQPAIQNNRYDEPQVSHVQYVPNPQVPSYGGQAIPNHSQGTPAVQPNGSPDNGAYAYPNNAQPNVPYGNPYGTSVTPANTTAQYNYQANDQRQYPGQYASVNREVGYQQGFGNGLNPNTQYNTADYTEEIPATPTNNTYRNPGVPNYGTSPYQNQPQIANNTAPQFDAQYGQLPRSTQNIPNAQQYNPSYTQPIYGQQPTTAVGDFPMQR